jgi:hypothetical protein
MTLAPGTRLGLGGILSGFLSHAANPELSLSSVVLFARPVTELEAAAREGKVTPCTSVYLNAVPRHSILRKPMTTAVPAWVLARRRQNLEPQPHVHLEGHPLP